MAKLKDDFFDRLTYGKGSHRTKVTITDELTGAVDEFYVMSEKYNFDDVKERIRGVYSGDPKDDEYRPYAVEYVEFVMSENPSIDEQKIKFKSLQADYVWKKTRLLKRYQNKVAWDLAMGRFRKSMPRHIASIFETALLED